MSKEYRIYQVDSFTKEIFKGNPAGVVANADGLSEQQMQQIAQELNNSETAFILSANDDSHDIWVRFFTPTMEVPICGHATIAAHYIYALENNLESTTVIQKTGAGNLPVEIIKGDDDYQILMTQGKIEFSDPFDDEVVNKICSGLGINISDLDERCPIQIVSTGHSKVLIGIKEESLLNSLKPNNLLLSQLSKEIGCNGYFVFTINPNDKNVYTNGRMFAPAIGIDEDPVTGNANGPLGAYLVKHKLANHDGKYLSYIGKQGEAIGRTGFINVKVEIANELPIKVKIGGNAVTAFQTSITI